MSPRKRIKKGLEPNLYENGGYYKYRHPLTKKEKGMGKDKKKANAAARQLNAIFMSGQDLVSHVMGTSSHTIEKVIERYKKELLPFKSLSPSTLKNYEYRLNRLETDLGKRIISNLDIKTVSDYLDSNFSRDAYIKHRNLLADVFKFAMTKGLFPNDQENPAAATYAKAGYNKERQRLTLDQFKAIKEAAPQWLKNAMDLSLVTLQGRFEICNAKFSDINDGFLRVVREKTKNKSVAAFMEIEINGELETIINRCRASGVVSPYMIHRKPERKNPSEAREHWTQILPGLLSKEFKKARDASGLFKNVPTLHQPSFHEIRALGSHLYEKYGYGTEDYVQPLMAHSDKNMTEHYQAGHEIKWNRVKAELPLAEILKAK